MGKTNAIPDVDLLLELSHLYKVTINEMLEDADLICELTGEETGYTGIAYFVPEPLFSRDLVKSTALSAVVGIQMTMIVRLLIWRARWA